MTAVVRKPAAARFLRIEASWPVIGLPVAFAVLFPREPRWVWMWALSFGIYAALKWLSLVADADPKTASGWRCPAYLCLWPGMDAKAFLDVRRRAPKPRSQEWIAALVNVACGLGLLHWVVPRVSHHSLFAAGWLGISAVCFVLHFGLFNLLSLGWRYVGIEAVPIMNAPYRSACLSEFWGRRWNLAFRDLAHEFVFRPLVGPWGIAGATAAVFVVSGLIHDLVISGAAGGGFGGPTHYFVIQAVGLLVERTAVWKRNTVGRKWLGWVFCAVVTLGPIGLLFHRPFIERVAIPMFRAFGVMGGGGA